MRYKRKKVNDMSVTLIDNISFKDFLKQNKDLIYNLARKNTKLNLENKPMISKDDAWFYEDEWDEHFKKDK
ncbi:MAG: hypothetical protein PHC81_06130 [Clostridia bacterium]|nr:hypothetical protein [Clostridia bacterium]